MVDYPPMSPGSWWETLDPCMSYYLIFESSVMSERRCDDGKSLRQIQRPSWIFLACLVDDFDAFAVDSSTKI